MTDEGDGKVRNIWVVYDRPPSNPGAFVAQRFKLHSRAHGYVLTSTPDALASPSLEALRITLRAMGLILMSEHIGADDPTIVESWF